MTTDLLVLALVLTVAVGIPLAVMAALGRKNHAMMKRAEQQRRYEAFTHCLARIEAKDVGPAQKIVAVRQLREFPEYRDLTVVMLGAIEVTGNGTGAEVFQNELKMTEQHLLKAEL